MSEVIINPMETPMPSFPPEIQTLQTTAAVVRDLTTESSQRFAESATSERAWVVVSVIGAFLVVLAIASIVVVLVLVPKTSTCQFKPRNGLGNPMYGGDGGE